TLRILEFGAGAGSASEALIRCLDEHSLLPQIKRYLITEPNAFFRRRAQRSLTDQYPELPLEWGDVDLNLPLATQGLGPAEFDLVCRLLLEKKKELMSCTVSTCPRAPRQRGITNVRECSTSTRC